MMQNVVSLAWPRFQAACAAVALVFSTADAADRTTCFVPQASDAAAATEPSGVLADQLYGEGAGAGWSSYIRIWRAHHADPSDASVRRFLGLPLAGVVDVQPRRGRSAPAWLPWRAGSYQQIDTPHFTILTRASADASKRVAEDLERCYWVWTQMFFPLWEAAPQVTTTLSGLSPDVSVASYLTQNSSRITIRRKLRVVLFRDASEYQQTLGRDIPGIERSTGFYSDENQTTFLYDAKVDDPATRRHEMVHQLFREATRSALGRKMPGEESGFWLIEGIAGYFESLDVGSSLATVGGWDSSRLQFARYRMLVGGDVMPMDELQCDGRVAAQQRQDLARWYAHAIAQTHRCMDGGDNNARRWIYRELAKQYLIKDELPPPGLTPPSQQRLDQFLAVDDLHLINNPARSDLVRLCLAGCEVTPGGLQTIPPSKCFSWLDLSRLPIGNDSVCRLAPAPHSIEQLTLEATRVDANLKDWLGQAKQLRELDLSWTPMDDSVIESIADATEMQTLWMTGTKISDDSIDPISRMRKLESVDVQRTDISQAGLARLRKLRPDLSINPLELRTE